MPSEAAKSDLTIRDVLELIRDTASQEWIGSDGIRRGATDNEGRRVWFIGQDIMDAVWEALR